MMFVYNIIWVYCLQHNIYICILCIPNTKTKRTVLKNIHTQTDKPYNILFSGFFFNYRFRIFKNTKEMDTRVKYLENGVNISKHLKKLCFDGKINNNIQEKIV